jgi:Flp pilus assembly pilin Flp
MNADDIWSLAAAIVTVALVTTIVSRPTSAQIITALGNAFSNSLRAAQGK